MGLRLIDTVRVNTVSPLALLSALSLITAGCATPDRTDREADRMIQDRAAGTPGITSNTVIDARTGVRHAPPQVPAELTLENALTLAARHNRDLQTRREALQRQAVSLRGTQRDYGFAVGGTLAYVLSTGEEEDSRASTLSMSATRTLPLGGTLSLSADSSLTAARTGGTNSTTSATSTGLRIEQPILAGAGYTASHQSLIQAERDTVYALRTFARDRQTAAIAVVAEFYQLLTQRAAVENARLNAQQSTLLRQRTEALFRVQRAPAIDVMRAQQQELAASNRLALAESSLESSRQDFLNTIGLPIGSESRITGAVPDVEPLPIAEPDAIRVALAGRVDLQTARDRAADAARNLAVAKSNLMPALGAYGEAAWSADGDRLLDSRDGEATYSAGVKLTLPLDKRSERDAVRTARMDLDQAERNAQQAEDKVRLDIAAAYRQTAYLAQAVQIEKTNLQIAGKRAENARLRFRNGELENRDVVEAENELLNARNALAQAQVQYAVQRLQVMQSAGILDVDANGMLVVLDGNKGVGK